MRKEEEEKDGPLVRLGPKRSLLSRDIEEEKRLNRRAKI